MVSIPKPACPLTDFRLDGWLVEPRLGRLSRGGTTIHARPQVVDLLAFLASRAGEVVSKEDILEGVWPAQSIGESALARCVAELRQLLDDDAHEPRIIQTIAKRGYRLVAPVTPVTREIDGSGPARSVMSSCGPGTGDQTSVAGQTFRSAGRVADGVSADQRHATSTPHVTRTTGTDADVHSASGERVGRVLAQPPRQLVGRLRHLWRLGGLGPALVAGLLLVVLAVLIIGRMRASAQVDGQAGVLIADFANRTGDASFDGTLKLALAVQLERPGFLRVVSDERVQLALRALDRPADAPLTGLLARDVCQREGAAAVVTGSIARFGARYVIGFEATECATGQALARELTEAAGKDQVLGALNEGAGRLRAKLAERLTLARSVREPSAPLTWLARSSGLLRRPARAIRPQPPAG
jgi:DNA-binding winged helix-turn-helix (wHTH) protein